MALDGKIYISLLHYYTGDKMVEKKKLDKSEHEPFGDLYKVIKEHVGGIRGGRGKLDKGLLIEFGTKVLDILERKGIVGELPFDYVEEKLGWKGGSRRGKPNHLKRQLNKLLKDKIGDGKILHVGQSDGYETLVFELREASPEEEKKWKEWK